ncbi:MAG TPA: metallophosphoesterase, partial [Flavobacterium sp.]|nr:metallophosphoesterase [Flavobacterium sp.]
MIFQSCATYEVQYGKNIATPIEKQEQNHLSHRFFLIGDAGNADEKLPKQTLELFEKRTTQADKNSTLVFLGDNIYPSGMPSDKNHKDRKTSEEKLTYQLEVAKKFKGKTVFIPGNHDWYHGIEGLEEQTLFVNEYLNDTKAFLPRKSCGVERLKINEQTVLLIVDSQWFLEDWNKIPTINDDCDIKTQADFFEEIKSQFDKNQDKVIVLAIHHPLISNSSHGGQVNSWRKQLFPFGNVPLPVLGSLLNFMRPTIGIPQDIQSKPYSELVNRIKTLIADRKNIIVISGHEHNLQYTEQENIKQIISGAGSKTDEARAVFPNDFSSGMLGYAVLDVYQNQSVRVDFYGNKEGEEIHLFGKNILRPSSEEVKEHPSEFPQTITTSIYSDEMTRKSKFYKWLFGEHYRAYYSKKIEVPVVQIDTLFGGLTPLRAGGGMQSNSLRLADKNGKEYAMRSLKKSTTRFIQNTLYPDQYVGDLYEDTGASDFLYDFYTSSNQYYGFIIDDLAKSVRIFHTNPKLYYVPKQKALGKYNNVFGDELYMIEERPMSEHSSAENFGEADDIISTSDLL